MLRRLIAPHGLLAPVLAAAAGAPCPSPAEVFSSPQNVSQSSDGSQLPSLVIDAAGTPRLFWHDFTGPVNLLWCAAAEGRAWAPGAPCEPNGTRSWSPRAAADPVAGLHLTWRDRTEGNDEVLYARFDGISWHRPVNLSRSPGPSGNPVVAVSAQGLPHVMWEEGEAGRKRFFESSFDGTSWSAPSDSGLPFTQGAALDALRIAFDARGTLHAAWHDGDTSLTEVWHAERSSLGWSAPENVSDTPFSLSAEPAIASGPGNAIHVAWVEQDSLLPAVFEICMSSRVGGAWGPKRDVSLQSAWCYRPAIAVGSDGLARIAWHADTGAGREVFFSAAPGTIPVNVSASAGADSARAALALDGEGRAWLAWSEGTTTGSEICAAHEEAGDSRRGSR